MRVVTKQERGEAVQARGINGIPDGAWLVGLEGHPATMIVADDEFRARFIEDTTEATVKARSNVATTTRRTTRETLTVPKAFPMSGTSEKIVRVLTETPMSTADIARAAGVNKSSVSRELKTLTKAHIAEKHERGSYSLGRKAAR